MPATAASLHPRSESRAPTTQPGEAGATEMVLRPTSSTAHAGDAPLRGCPLVNALCPVHRSEHEHDD